MTRKKIREHIYILLFRVDFHSDGELEEQAEDYLEGMENVSEKEKKEIEGKYRAVLEHLPELDALIEQKSKGWELKRIAKADLTALRLAAYEILFDQEVPEGVAINEAVELCKAYGTDRSASFVNGVLGSIAREQ